jgi:hypothetical protein
MDSTPLRDAYRAFLDAAATVTDAPALPPPPGEWTAEQILAHVSLVTAATIATVSAAATGTAPAYDNRLAQDPWTLAHVIALAGGAPGLRVRVRAQADALCALTGATLSEPELALRVPALLLSHGTPLADRPLSLRDILTGLATSELPGHAHQLLALLPTSP